MRVALVVAAARNGVIGHRGSLPWRLPDDMRSFRALTTGHCVLMGRRTFESIGRPLPDRTNLVLTRRGLRQADAAGSEVVSAPPGVRTFETLAAALAWARDAGCETCFVIGGEAIYRDALEHADRIHLTRVDAEPAGDVFFPALDPRSWRRVHRELHPADARHAHSFAFETWERIDQAETASRSHPS